jgi:7-cyano-7-deazaguanine reductase
MFSELQNTIDGKASLGQKSPYPTHYDKSLLFPISRALQRQAMKMPNDLKMFGFDVWNLYELFWLNQNGKPVRSHASLNVTSSSPHLLESKSVKLYLHSLNHERFLNAKEVSSRIEADIAEACHENIQIFMADENFHGIDQESEYRSVDDLDISVTTYQRAPELLKNNRGFSAGKLVSHVFKSHCLCTGQPDLGSIFIEYEGPTIDEAGLLAYLVSYRDHMGFSENCIEQIFVDILQRLSPQKLLVFGRFSRRGGIDINPYRSTHQLAFRNRRLIYQ